MLGCTLTKHGENGSTSHKESGRKEKLSYISRVSLPTDEDTTRRVYDCSYRGYSCFGSCRCLTGNFVSHFIFGGLPVKVEGPNRDKHKVLLPTEQRTRRDDYSSAGSADPRGEVVARFLALDRTEAPAEQTTERIRGSKKHSRHNCAENCKAHNKSSFPDC